jgi:hypothetical protein
MWLPRRTPRHLLSSVSLADAGSSSPSVGCRSWPERPEWLADAPGLLRLCCSGLPRRAGGLNILATVRHSLGSLDKVKRRVKTMGMVNSTPDFKEQPQVINGFSELMAEVFGDDAGVGARSAVGVGSLPKNSAVEIECIFEVV